MPNTTAQWFGKAHVQCFRKGCVSIFDLDIKAWARMCTKHTPSERPHIFLSIDVSDRAIG